MRVLLDLDGVITDFRRPAVAAHFRPPEDYSGPMRYAVHEDLGMTAEQFWQPLDYSFWVNLPFGPDGRSILAVVEQVFGPERVCILTSPPLNHHATSAKPWWIAHNLERYARRFLIGPAKEFAAGPGSLLIDDSEANVNAFRGAGGEAFLLPRPWNRSFGLDPLTSLRTFLAPYYRRRLERLKAAGWREDPGYGRVPDGLGSARVPHWRGPGNEVLPEAEALLAVGV